MKKSYFIKISKELHSKQKYTFFLLLLLKTTVEELER